MNRTEAITKANKKYQYKFDYSLFPQFLNNSQTVVVICPFHGPFTLLLKTHLHGNGGCRKCNYENKNRNRKTRDILIQQAKDIHGDKYDYSQVPSFPGINSKVTIICPVHGEFKQTLNHHIHTKSNCQECAKGHSNYAHISSSTIELLNDKKWLQDQHNTKSLIQIAKELGVSDTFVGTFLHKHSIPVLSHNQSSAEHEIYKFLQTLNIEIIRNTRTIIPPFELDLFLPEFNIAIEYCGLYWHSEQLGKGKWYHVNKTNKCNEVDIQLITIFEDEWIHTPLVVKQSLLHKLQKNTQPTVYARKTKIVQISNSIKKEFFERYHIQGNGPGSITYGLTYNTKIKACVTISNQNNQIAKINRYATSAPVIGGFSKLFTHIKRTHSFSKYITFADRRWSNGTLYLQTGFYVDKILDPDYTYCYPGTVSRIHKFNFRRKFLEKRLRYFDSRLSERQNCDDNNILRIWDCGKLRYCYDN